MMRMLSFPGFEARSEHASSRRGSMMIRLFCLLNSCCHSVQRAAQVSRARLAMVTRPRRGTGRTCRVESWSYRRSKAAFQRCWLCSGLTCTSRSGSPGAHCLCNVGNTYDEASDAYNEKAKKSGGDNKTQLATIATEAAGTGGARALRAVWRG